MTGTTIIPGAVSLYLAAALCFMLTAILAGPVKESRPAVFLAATGFLILSVHGGLLIYFIGRLPLIGGYEALTVLSWTQAALLLIRRNLRQDRGILTISGFLLAFLCAGGGLAGLEINYDYFMYVSIWAQGFFFFKLLSAGVMLAFATALLASIAFRRPVFDKRLFMAGAIIFLCSELSGSIWCLQGWGDSWHWSKNFFESAMVFFIFMTNLHLPMHLFKNSKLRMTLHLASAIVITGFFIW